MYRSQSGGCFDSFFKSNVKASCRGAFWLTTLAVLFLSSHATHAQSCAQLPSGLVSWWSGETNAFDQLGGNNGVLVGNTIYEIGKVGSSFGFDGNGDYVALGNPNSLQLQNFSIEAWIKRSSDSVVSYGTDGRGNFLAYGNGGYAFYLGSDSHLYLSKVGTVAWAGSAVITDTNFHHVVVTKTNNLASFYIDGAIDAIVTFNDNFTFTQPIVIGAEVDNLGNNCFLGRIDELSVYNRALTGAEIQGIYSAGTSGKCPTTVFSPTNLLINVDFAQSAPIKTGFAATGQTSGDYWNPFTNPNGVPLNLKREDGAPTSATVTMQGGIGGTTLTHPDVMYQTIVYRQSNSMIFAVTNLPTGQYAFYLYGHAGADTANTSFELTVGGVNYGTKATVNGPSWSLTNWVEGAQYVAFQYVSVTNGGAPVIITCRPGQNGYAYVNGMQIQGLDPTPVIKAQPVSQTVIQGTNVAFAVDARGTAPLAYQWLFNGTNLPAATNATLTLTNVQLTEAGPYAVVVSNAFGNVTSSNALLTVIVPPPCEPTPSGVATFWSGEGNVEDRVGILNGYLFGGTTFAPGKVGQAFSFDGIDDSVTNTMFGLTNILNTYTMELWAYPTMSRAVTSETTSGTSGNSNQRYAVFPYPGTTGGIVGSGISIGTNGVSVFEAGTGYMPSLLVYNTPIIGWTHIAVVYVNRQPSLYINGVLVRTGVTSVNASCPSTWLGERGPASANQGYYGGLLDEYAIYNRALSATEIQGIYNAGISGKCTPQIAPFIYAQPANRIAFVSDVATMNVAAGGTAPLAYQWRLNGTNLPGQTTSSLPLINLLLTNSGNYTVVITNAFGSVTSSVAVLLVVSPSSAPLFNVDFAPGSLSKTGFAAIGQTPTDFWNAFNSASGVPFNVKQADGTLTGVVVIQNNAAGGTTLSHPDPMYQTAIYRPGNTITLTVTNLATGQYAFYLYGHAGADTANTSFQLTVGSTSYGAKATVNGPGWSLTNWVEGAQYVVFRDVNVTAGGVPVVITCSQGQNGYTYVNGMQIQANYLALPKIVTQPISKSVFIGDTTNFTVAATGDAPLAYQWIFNGTNNLVGQTATSLSLANIQGSNAGDYAVTVSNVFGCVTSSIARLNVLFPAGVPLINVDFAAGTAIKTGFAAIGQTSADYWNAFNNPSGVPFDLKQADGVPTSATVSFQGGGGGTTLTHPDVMYQTMMYGNTITLTVSNLATGQYGFYLYGHAGADTANTSFQLTVGGTNYGTKATVNGPGWSLTNWVEGAQYVVFQNVNVMNGAEPVIITCRPGQNGIPYLNGMQIQNYNAAPAFLSPPVSRTVVVGSNTVFTTSLTGAVPLAYQWLCDGTNLPAATNASLTLTNVQLTHAGSYAVMVSNAFGSVLSSNAMLTVVEPVPCVPIPSGVVNWWAGEGNGEDQVDILTNYMYGGTTFAPGKIGQGFSFDGINDSVTNAVPCLTNIVDSFTMEFWAWPTAGRASTVEGTSGITGHGGQRYAIFPAPDPSGSVGAGVSVGTNGVSVFEHGNLQLYSPLVYDAPIFGWTHVAVAYSNQVARLYLNGALVRTGLQSGRHSFPSTWLGERGPLTAYQGFYAGLLDEYTIYNRTLSATEIQGIYDAGFTGKCLPEIEPYIITPPQNQISYVSGIASLNVVAKGNRPLAYQWRFNGTNLPGQTTTSLKFASTRLTDTGDYTVVITNVVGSVTSAIATLTVLLPPSSSLINVDFSADSLSKTGFAAIGLTSSDYWNGLRNAPLANMKQADGTATLAGIMAQGQSGTWGLTHPDIMYQTMYYLQGSGIILTVTNLATARYDLYLYGHAGADTANTSFEVTVGGTSYGTKATVNGPGWSLTNWVENAQYVRFRDVIVTNGGAPLIVTCRAGQNSYTYVNGMQIEQHNPAPVLLTQPISKTAIVGTSPFFTASADGMSPLSYQWQFNGTNLSAATNSTLTLTNVQFDQAGTYSVVVSNDFGFATSSNATLTVIPPPPCVPPVTGLMNWWAGESDVTDQVGNLTGYRYGGVTFAPGAVGQGFSFDGISGSVTNAVWGLTNLLDTYTMEFWAWPGKTRAVTSQSTSGVSGSIGQSYAVFPCHGGSGANAGSGVSVGTNGVSVFEFAANYLPSLLVHNATLTNWTHIAVVYSNRQPSLYLNGVLVRTGLTSAKHSFPSTWLGERGPITPSVGFYRGLLDEYAIYNRALTASEILNIFNAGISGKCHTPVSPNIATQPTNTFLNLSNSTSFSVLAGGNYPLTYQWRFNGSDIESATNSSLLISNVLPSMAGLYSVAITNLAGFIISSNAQLKVKVMSIVGNGLALTNPSYSFNTNVVIQLQSFFGNNAVFYTLDGSSPSLLSTQYSDPFVVAQSVTLRAMAYSSDFVESGESDPISLTLPPSYNLLLGTAGGGSVSANPASGPYLSNTIVTLTATPAAGWTFLKWLGDATGSSAITNVTMTRNKTAQAIFGSTLSTTTAGGGAVLLNPPGGIYPYGSVVQLSAIPDAGNFFDIWGNAASGNINPLNFTLTNANVTVSSQFAAIGGGQSTLTVVPVGLGQVNVSPSANVYPTGSEVTVTATPNSGQFFVGWSGDATGTANPLSVTVDANKLIYANFTTLAQLTLVNPATLRDEGVQLLISGNPGDKYSLVSSTNLFDWISLVTLSNTFGTATFKDMTATNANEKFYRTSIVP